MAVQAGKGREGIELEKAMPADASRGYLARRS